MIVCRMIDCGTTIAGSQAPLLRFVPASHTRPPSMHVSAIQFVICPEFPTQSWLFIKDDEQMYGEGNRCDGSNRQWAGVSEYNPQPAPARGEALVHGVPHVAVETHHNQSLRRRERGRCAASRPAEVPHAAQGNRESQHRRKRGQPSPMCCARHFHAETEPLRQQPEPQGEERRAYCQRGYRRWPSLSVRNHWNASRLSVCHAPSDCNFIEL